MTVQTYDDRNCSLGEGPLWHPERQQLFWFDINNKKLLTREHNHAVEWQFDKHVSAAGWGSHDELLIASEVDLFVFNIATQESRHICDLEADNVITRSNDGRADPWGGFWIGTMGHNAESGAGSIYRFFEGKAVKLFSGISITNSICFAPDRSCAYYTDTLKRQIMKQPLDALGWPQGEPYVFIDMTDEGLSPDGSVIDADGCLWNAQWGSSRVAQYAPDGAFLSAVELPAKQITCPAFGGDGLSTLFVTSANEHMDAPPPEQGRTFSCPVQVTGLSEYRVIV